MGQQRIVELGPSRLPGQYFGRCRVSRRAEVAIRHGIWTSVRRTVAVVARASSEVAAGAASVAAARVRLNAITASTSQAAFAVNTPDGRCASADALRSACASSRAILCSDVSSRLAAADGAGDLDSRGLEVSSGRQRPSCRSRSLEPVTQRAPHDAQILSDTADRGPRRGLVQVDGLTPELLGVVLPSHDSRIISLSLHITGAGFGVSKNRVMLPAS